jgi:protocatechuate 3,4-dioxygenase beta subunit
VEGVVVRLGTNEPITGVDIELIRVGGTRCAALAAGAADAYSRMVAQGGNGSRDVPPALAPEARYAKTLDSGRFVFRNLPEGTYRLVADRGGGEYSPAAYGQRDPRGEGLAFPLAEGQALQGANIAMAASAAISGRVFDADNEPVSHALVLALEPQYKNGRRTLNIAQAVESEERGEFRLFWLTPGRYYVAAKFVDTRRRSLSLWIVPPGRTGRNERADAPVITKRTLPGGETVEGSYALVYYGGTLNPDDARPLDLISGTTFQPESTSKSPQRSRGLFSVPGRAINSRNRPVAQRDLSIWETAADAAGRFVFLNVPRQLRSPSLFSRCHAIVRTRRYDHARSQTQLFS